MGSSYFVPVVPSLYTEGGYMLKRDPERTATGWRWLDLLTRPWWLWRMARAERQLMAIIGHGDPAEGRRVMRVELERRAAWAESQTPPPRGHTSPQAKCQHPECTAAREDGWLAVLARRPNGGPLHRVP